MDLFSYDPVTGISEYFDMDPDGKVSIHSTEDVQPLLDYNQALRNEKIKDIKDIDGLMLRHYASVPMTVIMEMYNKGINFFDKNDFPRVIDEINTNYPALKVTDKHHSESGGRKRIIVPTKD